MRELISCIRNFPRHLSTAAVNIWRNSAMSFSAVFAVTITLVLIGSVSLLAVNITEVTNTIEEGVHIYVKLERTLSEEEEQNVGKEIEKISGVKSATYSSKDEELDKLIESYGDEGDLFESYRKDNPLGSAYEVEAEDPTNLASLADKIEVLDGVNSVEYGGSSTNNMVETLKMIRTGGYVVVAGLGIIALLLISNTIKMAITTRKDEISIMRMVGASNWYIRLPFMLEGMLIGLLGSIVPVLFIIFGYRFIYNLCDGMVVSAMLTLVTPMPLVFYISGIVAAMGAGVGLIGSYLSIRRFLKI